MAPPVVPPAAPVVQAAAPVAVEATYTWFLASDDGTHRIDRDHFVGRRPGADAGAVALVLEDRARTLSRTHAVLRPVREGLVLEDLGSANGTRIERSGTVFACPEGTPVPVGHGDVLWFGEVRAQVYAAHE
ncbi:FHA domain-containing protein [Demequina subtropica]|uniref:FHA domain-containing protein n=1 Tax=Demequina subtropica TaxID=1638989 RepID=UPI00078665A7|nr:FHA domain-containing protein [Demequina subtropica]